MADDRTLFGQPRAPVTPELSIMSLLTIQQIQRGLDAEYLPMEPALRGYRLVAGGVSASARIECERGLGTTFPTAFRDAIEAFDFGWLTIGPVSCCGSRPLGTTM